MLQISNLTRFAVDRTIAVDRTSAQIWVIVIKATFEILENGAIRAVDQAAQEPVCAAPEHFGEPGKSSLRRETELVHAHPGTDVIVNASAHSPGGVPRREVMVGIEVGPVRKALRVVGERYWRRGVGAITPTLAEPFVTMPIRYERAYGGASPSDLSSPYFDLRNPVGSGFHRSVDEILGQPAPNIEEPDHPITSSRPSSRPAGLGIIAPWWSPRCRFGGTYDEEWRKNRMPFLPDDFDPRFFSCASPGLATAQHLRGGERVELVNLSPNGRLSFRLPSLRFIVSTLIDRQRVNTEVFLDRVIIEPDEHRLVTVWRSCMPCGSNARRIKKSVVAEKPRIAK